MKINPEFKKYMQERFSIIIKEVLQEVAKEITLEVRNYVAKTLYSRPSSIYYDRDGENGGFLGTFADATNMSQVVEEMTRTQGNKIFITYVLRDFSKIRYKAGGPGRFGHHTSFEGVETTNKRARSELDNIINNGWSIVSPHNSYVTGKRIQGIHFREYAKSYIKKHANRMIQEKLSQRGLSSQNGISQSRKRLSISLDSIQIIAE